MEPELALLDRYLAGDCTHAEAATVRRWLDSDPHARQRLAGIAEIREVASTDAPWDIDGGWRRMAHQMAAVAMESDLVQETPAVEPPSSRGQRQSVFNQHTPWYAALGAAALALLVLLTALPWKQSGTIQVPSQRVSTYTTGAGQRAMIALPDGSRVLLNVGSRLEVPVDYDRGNRTLRLSGEALFTVIHHESTPFIVVTGTSTTRVLGTSFLVRQYDTDSAAVVAVRDGKVMVQSTVLTAMQQVFVKGPRDVSEVAQADPAKFTFASGVLTLADMPLVSAIPELNRWYDTDIHLGDPRLMHRNIAGGFTTGSVTDLAAILELTYDVRVVREGRTLTLYPKQ